MGALYGWGETMDDPDSFVGVVVAEASIGQRASGSSDVDGSCGNIR